MKEFFREAALFIGFVFGGTLLTVLMSLGIVWIVGNIIVFLCGV